MNKNNINSSYSAAFTAGALLYQEMNSVLHLLMQPNGEELMKDEIKKNEFLNVASINTRKRYVPELIRRYKAVPVSFWQDYLSFSEKAQRVALFYVVMKTYKLIWDFHINVTIPKWKSFDSTITKEVTRNDTSIYEFVIRIANTNSLALSKIQFNKREGNIEEE